MQSGEARNLMTRNNATIITAGGATVGLAGGFVQGAGHSAYTSYWGLAADHVLEINAVTADGRVVTANAERNADLFWAFRGGGGGKTESSPTMPDSSSMQVDETVVDVNTLHRHLRRNNLPGRKGLPPNIRRLRQHLLLDDPFPQPTHHRSPHGNLLGGYESVLELHPRDLRCWRSRLQLRPSRCESNEPRCPRCFLHGLDLAPRSNSSRVPHFHTPTARAAKRYRDPSSSPTNPNPVRPGTRRRASTLPPTHSPRTRRASRPHPDSLASLAPKLLLHSFHAANLAPRHAALRRNSRLRHPRPELRAHPRRLRKPRQRRAPCLPHHRAPHARLRSRCILGRHQHHHRRR